MVMRRVAALAPLAFALVAAAAPALAQQHPGRVAATRPPAGAPPAYAQAMNGWHAMPHGAAAPVDESGRPKLVFVSLNRNERVELAAAGDAGGFAAEDLDRAAHVLRAAGGEEHPVDPRIVDIVYRIQTHFHAPEIRVVSGYRVPTGRSVRSNHGKGRAIDFVVPGTPDQDVARFSREIGFVGVGIYPTSQFVHVDIRPRSYFWVDYSGPGKRNRERGILGDVAAWSDQQALRRGQKPIEPFDIATNVDAILRARAAAAAATDQDDDDADSLD
jgi:uncharacterized protein YcbK (DUF882 family)